LLLVAPTVVADTDTHYGVSLTGGYDTNPLWVADDGPDGAFAELRLDGGVTRYVGDGSIAAFFAQGHVATRLDSSRTADAARDSGSVRIGTAISPPFAAHRLAISAGANVSAYRGTFTDRATGSIYEASVAPATDPPSTIPIPDRLDSNTSGLFLDLRFKQNARLTWFLETSADRTAYLENYEAETDLDRLDFHALRIRPGASIGIGPLATLRVQIALTDLDYDDRPALDRSGVVVAGTTRSYRYAQYQVSLNVRPTDPWNLSLALASGGRDDTYAGYYDNVSRAGVLSVDRALGARSRLRVFATLRELDYDRATITGDPADGIRGSDERSYVARWSRRFGERLGWYVESGLQQTESEDPVFAYDRNWFLSGIRFGG
jgi:hypothetical protein